MRLRPIIDGNMQDKLLIDGNSDNKMKASYHINIITTLLYMVLLNNISKKNTRAAHLLELRME